MSKVIYIVVVALLGQNLALACEGKRQGTNAINDKLMTIKQVRSSVLNGKLKNQNVIFTSLDKLMATECAEANYLYAVIYYFGLIGEKSLEKAVHHLEISAAMNHVEGSYLLGSILLTEFPTDDTKRGVKLLEFAADKGHVDAMFNLFSLFKQGVYTNERAAMKWLMEAAKLGEENSALVYANELYLQAKENKSNEKAEEALKVIKNTHFHEFKGEAYFLNAQIYGNSELPKIYNKDQRDFYLQKSASLGFERAVELWSKYEKLQRESQ